MLNQTTVQFCLNKTLEKQSSIRHHVNSEGEEVKSLTGLIQVKHTMGNNWFHAHSRFCEAHQSHCLFSSCRWYKGILPPLQ